MTAELRIRPYLKLARKPRRSRRKSSRFSKQLCERLLAEDPQLSRTRQSSARLHGDPGAAISRGRRTVTANPRWLVDPAAYGGHLRDRHRDVRPFGAPAIRPHRGYCEANPLAEGWRSRIHCIRSTCYSFTPCSSAAGIPGQAVGGPSCLAGILNLCPLDSPHPSR